MSLTKEEVAEAVAMGIRKAENRKAKINAIAAREISVGYGMPWWIVLGVPCGVFFLLWFFS